MSPTSPPLPERPLQPPCDGGNPFRAIRLYHQGAVRELTGVDPHRTVLDWLREDMRRTGTKEGCNEGDCGACTVIVAEWVGEPEGAPDTFEPASARQARIGPLRLRTVNACLQPLPALDGKALLTVEDLSPPGGPLHPVQQALVDAHASQCGFCTPGIAMTLAACLEQAQTQGRRPDREGIVQALAGNLCRCTGYRPIIQAGLEMFDLPAKRLDLDGIANALAALQSDPALHHRPAEAGPLYLAPRKVSELTQMLERHPQARLTAGMTDLGLAVNKRFQRFDVQISTLAVAELRHIQRRTSSTGEVLSVGAAVPLEDAWCALSEVFPTLSEAWRRFASPPVRHAGTLGGNIVNGSPIGDGPPVLMALGATLRLQLGDRQRSVPIDEFYLGYQRTALQPGEFLRSIEIALPASNTATRSMAVRAWKHAKRHDSDISAVFGAFGLTVEHTEPGPGTVVEVRLAFGGIAATPCRAARAEAALAGQPWTEERVRAAMQALAQDFTPLSDLRASAGHRRRIAAQFLWRLWLETRRQDPLPASQVDVHHPLHRLGDQDKATTPSATALWSAGTQP